MSARVDTSARKILRNAHMFMSLRARFFGMRLCLWDESQVPWTVATMCTDMYSFHILCTSRMLRSFIFSGGYIFIFISSGGFSGREETGRPFVSRFHSKTHKQNTRSHIDTGVQACKHAYTLTRTLIVAQTQWGMWSGYSRAKQIDVIRRTSVAPGRV